MVRRVYPLVMAASLLLIHNCLLLGQTASNKTADDILRNIVRVLKSNTSFSYTYTRETKYHADNYYHKRTASFYMQQYNPGIINLRYLAKDATMHSVFNGTQVFNIDLTKGTIDSSSVTFQGIKSNSHLYHSFAMLQQSLPIVMQDSGFSKTISDTIINGKNYWKIVFEKANSYFGVYTGLESIDPKYNIRRPYELIADKKTYLPKLFIARFIRGNDDRDFIKMTYEKIQLQPADLPRYTWEYASYIPKYKPFVPEQIKEEIKVGQHFPGFSLPEYKPFKNAQVSFTKYKGKTVLIEFWFKSCGPCMEAMPRYKELQSNFPADSFQLITINVEDKKEDIAFFYKKYLPTYPMLYNGAKMFKELGFSACPTALLINSEGTIVKKYAGFNIDKLKDDISTILK